MRRGTDFTHGTRSAMRNYGCHCEDCRAGNALRQRELRDRRAAAGAFRCGECGVAYLWRWHLERHQRDRHGEDS